MMNSAVASKSVIANLSPPSVMCVCVYIHIYIYIYIYVCVCVSVCVCARARVCVCVCVCVKEMGVNERECVYMYTCVVCACTRLCLILFKTVSVSSNLLIALASCFFPFLSKAFLCAHTSRHFEQTCNIIPRHILPFLMG